MPMPMPRNKRESLIFTLLMCSFMVFFMSIYNLSFDMGLTVDTVKHAWLGFPLAFVVALLLDWFVVAGAAKKLAFWFAGEQRSSLKMILLISTSMVCAMVVLMSFYGALWKAGFSVDVFHVWLILIPRNFVVALPLQLLIAGPLVRFTFRRTFPVGVISI